MRRAAARALLLVSLAAPLWRGADAAEPSVMPPGAIEAGRLDIAEWQARHEAKLYEARSRPIDLVLLGDSITEQYERTGPEPWLDYRRVWQQFYGDRRALNLGFSGDGTPHLLWRIRHGEIDGLTPKAAVILIGTNDIGWLHRTAAEAVAGIAAIVAEIRSRLPTTPILLVGVLPSDRGASIARATAETDTELAALFGGGAVPGVTYLDVSSVFLRNGSVDPSLFRDRFTVPPEPALHPTPEGQALLAGAIEATLSTWLADRRHDR